MTKPNFNYIAHRRKSDGKEQGFEAYHSELMETSLFMMVNVYFDLNP